MRFAGFSLTELMFALLVVAVLLAVGVPGLGRLALDARRTADINAFVTAVQLARSESAKRAAPVTLCRSADGIGCGGGGSEMHYDAGWLVFVEDAGEPVLYFHEPAMQGTIRSNRARYTFRPYYRRSTNGTVVFCDERGAAAARTVILSYTGRPRVSATDARGRPLQCPG